jgi:hypothetical protein
MKTGRSQVWAVALCALAAALSGGCKQSDNVPVTKAQFTYTPTSSLTAKQQAIKAAAMATVMNQGQPGAQLEQQQQQAKTQAKTGTGTPQQSGKK